MDFLRLLSLLEDKDTSAAFGALKELEALSDTSAVLYPFINKFIEMVDSEKYVIRCRGFRLLCKQAKWDADGVLDEHLDSAMNILNDAKPTAVRQALAALQDVVPYKKNLHGQIRQRVNEIDYLRYKDTMHSLIANDIDDLLNKMAKS